LVPPGDPQALANAIAETIRHPPDPLLLQEAIQRFDRDLAIGAYLCALGLEPDRQNGGDHR